MTPVFQTIHGPKGNCYEACLASILDCPLDHVNLDADSIYKHEWMNKAVDFSASYRGFRLWFIKGDEKPLSQQTIRRLAIAHLKTITGDIHTVVVKDGKVIHDPSPRPLSNPEFPVVLWSIIECPD